MGMVLGERPVHVEVIEAGKDLKFVVMNLGLYYVHDFTEFLDFRCPADGKSA